VEYTKGEWKASFHYPHAVSALVGKRPPCYTPIAQMTAPEQVEMEANSLLIAAAPDNYEANKLNLSFLEELVKQYPELDRDYRVQALITTDKKAIAKAEGNYADKSI